MSEVFDNNYKLIKSEKIKAKNESEILIENCFRTTILKGLYFAFKITYYLFSVSTRPPVSYRAIQCTVKRQAEQMA